MSALLPNDLDLTPTPAEFKQPGPAWKAAVLQKHAEILEERTQHLLANAIGIDDQTKPTHFIPNEVHVVTQSYMTNTFASEQWQATTNHVSDKFHLNKEQDQAFRIITNHMCSDADHD